MPLRIYFQWTESIGLWRVDDISEVFPDSVARPSPTCPNPFFQKCATKTRLTFAVCVASAVSNSAESPEIAIFRLRLERVFRVRPERCGSGAHAPSAEYARGAGGSRMRPRVRSILLSLKSPRSAKTRQTDQCVRRAKPFVTPAVCQLQGLGDKLYLADAAPAQFYVKTLYRPYVRGRSFPLTGVRCASAFSTVSSFEKTRVLDL